MAKVSQTTPGQTTDGLTAGDDEAVFTVNTGDLVFDGGSRTFTLNASEPGKNPRTVNVKLNVTPNKTGAAVFKLLEKTDGVEYLERLGGNEANFDGLVSAFIWVEQNAEADTEYTIWVEKNETNVPNLVAGLNMAENAGLRLRGTKDGPWPLHPMALTQNPEILNKENFTSSARAFIQVGGSKSGFTGTYPKKTFFLGRNVTIQSGAIQSGWLNNRFGHVLMPARNATLVLEPGSKITGHDTTSGGQTYVIYLDGTGITDTTYSKLRIEGGEISNCRPNESYKALIKVRYYSLGSPVTYIAAGSFYLAPGNVLTLTGNTYNDVFFKDNTDKVDLTQYLANGLSRP
jgi:hypothetical protein